MSNAGQVLKQMNISILYFSIEFSDRFVRSKIIFPVKMYLFIMNLKARKKVKVKKELNMFNFITTHIANFNN